MATSDALRRAKDVEERVAVVRKLVLGPQLSSELSDEGFEQVHPQ